MGFVVVEDSNNFKIRSRGICMFKRNTVLIYLVIIVLVTVVYYINTNKDVPRLEVYYKGTELEVGQGSYRWKTHFKEKVFTVDSNADVVSNLLPGMSVAPNSKLEMNFSQQPKYINIRGGYSLDNAPTIIENVINIPEKKGTQIYFLDCEWKEGTVTYIIVIQVQS